MALSSDGYLVIYIEVIPGNTCLLQTLFRNGTRLEAVELMTMGINTATDLINLVICSFSW